MLNRIPHWLINIVEPTEIYSAARFVADALNAIETIVAEGKIPVLVGGSMMYFNSLLNGLSKLPAADASIRAELELKIKKSGMQSLYAQLQLIDPLSAKRLHPNQKQRKFTFLMLMNQITRHACVIPAHNRSALKRG